MKKRAMKKYIPKNTCYCYKYSPTRGYYRCKWFKFLGINKLNRETCEYAPECGEKECKCQYSIYRCEYLGFTDKQNETLLWDECKECNVSDW